MTKLLLLLSLCPILAFGQESQVKKTLYGFDWEVTGPWFGSEQVTLVVKSKLDTADLSLEKKQIYMEAHRWGERISFSPAGVMRYAYVLSCAVGELLYDLKKIEVTSDGILVDYNITTWEEKPHASAKLLYQPIKCTPEKVVLKLVKKLE